MFKKISLVLAVLWMTASCGKVEDDKNKDNIPGDDLKKLTIVQSNNMRDLMGALGDLAYVMEDVAEDQVDFQPSERALNTINRAEQRGRFRNTLQVNRCDVKASGKSFKKDFNMNIGGLPCRFIYEYQNRHQVLSAQESNRSERSTILRKYVGNNHNIDTDIYNSNLMGTYTYRKKVTERTSRVDRRSDIEIDGNSRRVGGFEFNLEERWIHITELESGEVRQEYRRVDRFQIHGKYKVTLFKIVENLQSSKTVRGFAINGRAITESEYQQMMQDMERQVGMERFNDGTMPSPSSL